MFCVILCIIALDQVIFLKISAKKRIQYGFKSHISSNRENSDEDGSHRYDSYEHDQFDPDSKYYGIQLQKQMARESYGRSYEELSHYSHHIDYPYPFRNHHFGGHSYYGESDNGYQTNNRYGKGSEGKIENFGNGVENRLGNPTTPQPSKCFPNLNSEYEPLIIISLIALIIPLSYCLYLSYQHYVKIKEIQRKRSQKTVKALANSNKPFNVFLI